MKRMMWSSIFITLLAIPLMTSSAYGGPVLKTHLIPCDFTCGSFGIPGTEGFVGPGEPATLSGDVVASSTGVLKIKVLGATPNVTFTVLVGNFVTGPTLLPATLTTDGAGDGVTTNNLSPGTYISEVFLLRDTDNNTVLEPRILAGFLIP